MAVQRPYQEQITLNASTATLAARPGSGRMVRRIAVNGGSGAGYATIRNGPTTVGYYATGDATQNHLAMRPNNAGGFNIFDVLKALALPYKIPVAEGDALTVDLGAQTGTIKIEYADVDPGDIDESQAFGRSAKTGPVVLYGTNSAASAASGYIAIDQTLMPADYTSFPYARDAEPGRTYAIHALLAQDIDVTTASAGEEWRTQFTRYTLNREVMFDPSRQGFLTQGAAGTQGTAATTKNAGANELPFLGDGANFQPFMLNAPLMVNPGDELNVEQSQDYTAGAGFAAGDLLVAVLAELNPPAKQGG